MASLALLVARFRPSSRYLMTLFRGQIIDALLGRYNFLDKLHSLRH